MLPARGFSNVNSTPRYSHVPRNEDDRSALPPFRGHLPDTPPTASTQPTLHNSSTSLNSSTSIHVAVEHGQNSKRSSRAILLPLTFTLSCLLLPGAVLVALTVCYKVEVGKSFLESAKALTNVHMLYVDVSATILTNISSVSSTLAPFLVAVIMEIWSPYVARALLKASQENLENNHPLPTPTQFSLLANMRAGRCDQVWKYWSHRRRSYHTRPLILRHTAVVLFMCLLLAFFTFLGDQFFHVWSESVNLHRYTTPNISESFGRGLTPECRNFDRSSNFGWPCTRDASIPPEEHAERQNQLSYLRANTSEVSQIRFLTAVDLPQGDLAVLYPAPGLLSSNFDYRASSLGVSTQCQSMKPACQINHISTLLTQFNCSDTFFGVLGKPANVSYDMFSKAQDPDVPGLAWKISTSLQYAFYSDNALEVPYNVMGYNPITGDNDPTLPLLPDSELVNPVFLSVAGRVTADDIAIDSTLSTQSASDMFLPTYGDSVFDFFLNCSYTTYDIEYTVINGTTQPDFIFTPTPNGSVAEEWHGRQQYVSLNGDPSGGLDENNFIAAKQKNPAAFARTWANLYSVRVLAVIGAYTDPRLNIQEQIRLPMLVTRIVPWTLYFLLAANLTYALLALVVGAMAYLVSTQEVIRVAENMDLNKQIAEKYAGVVEMRTSRKRSQRKHFGNAATDLERLADTRLRVGVIGSRFESLSLAV